MKPKPHIVLLISLLFLIIFPYNQFRANASETDQTTPASFNTVYAGYNLYTLRPKAAASYSLNGFLIGWNIDFNLTKSLPLYLGTGIDWRFTFRSKTYHDSDTYNEILAKVSTHFINFNIPVNLSYRLPLSGTLFVIPQFGFDFRVQVDGKARTSVSVPEDNPNRLIRAVGFTPGNVNLFSKSSMGNESLRRFQFGWHAALKLQYDSFVLGISYGTDFAKLRNELGSSNLMVNLGYVF